MVDKNIDKKLIEQALEGKREAFDELVIKYQHKITRLVSRFVNDRSIVGDITQDTFFNAYRCLEQFHGNSAFYTWLYRIAVNTSKNYLKHNKREVYVDNLEYTSSDNLLNHCYLDDCASPEHMILCDEMQDTFLLTVKNMPRELSESIILREIKGLSYEQIAHVMKCPVGTVRSRIFRARSELDKNIKPYLH